MGIKKIIKNISKPITNSIKGHIGEAKVSNKLNPLIWRTVNHKQINNLILIDDNGKSHQIDHIEIRANGIFCIETKNYKGWIFGNENQREWTQVLYNEKHQFLNPLKQNKSHIYQLSNALNGKYKINSIVVFVQNNADKIECTNVINLKDLASYLKKFDDGTRYTEEEMNIIYNTFLEISTKISNKEHVKNIAQTQKELKVGICPRCGGKLIDRTGKYGNFKRCSNYPKCKFTLTDKI